ERSPPGVLGSIAIADPAGHRPGVVPPGGERDAGPYGQCTRGRFAAVSGSLVTIDSCKCVTYRSRFAATLQLWPARSSCVGTPLGRSPLVPPSSPHSSLGGFSAGGTTAGGAPPGSPGVT